jgi:hydrogenase-4 component B
MHAVFLSLTWITPLLLLPLAAHRSGRWWLPLGALPALTMALWAPLGTSHGLPWLLLGVHLELDATGQLFLLYSALLWGLAGLYAAGRLDGARAGRFRGFFLAAMAGNLLLILAADGLSFYLGFALMGLSAYALVAHRRSQRARQAARVYLIWTLAGEMALFAAILLLAASAESLRFADLAWQETPTLAVVLLLFGFGVKLALPGLHFWLPGAYAMAPAAAAAVLSGPMIAAGLLGWLRFLPVAQPGLAAWGQLLLLIGSVGVLLGVLAGVVQRCPRRVLGYSSVAKMGLISALFGLALLHPEAAPAMLAALALFAMHHLLVKGALFLGLGLWEDTGPRPWLLGGMGLLALSLAGAPLTGGAAAKALLGDALPASGPDLSLLFLFAAVGTVLLMVRLLWLLVASKGTAVARKEASSGAPAVWLLLTSLALWLPYRPEQLSADGSALLPLALGLAIAALAWFLSHRGFSLQLVSPGRTQVRQWRHSLVRWRFPQLPQVRIPPGIRAWRGQAVPLSLPLAGLLWLGLSAVLFSTFIMSG